MSNKTNEDIFSNMVNKSLNKTKKVKKEFKIKKVLTNMTIPTLISMIMLSSLKGDTNISKINVDKDIPNTSISMDYIDLETTKIPYFEEYKSNVFDSNSDSFNIYVHNISNEITNGIKNKLTKREYAFLCEALKGKKIRDIISSDGTFNVDNLDLDNIFTTSSVFSGSRKLTFDEIEQIKNKIKKTKFYKENNFYKDEILDTTIVEIVSKESGFDAIVLEKNGDYFITNTCCGEEKEDIVMVMYDLTNRLVGDKEFYKTIAPILFRKGTSYEFLEKYGIEYEDIINAEKYYKGQIADSYKLVSKYLLEGKNIKLGGYSLGAGTMLESYMLLEKENPNICKNLNITLYNPYLGLIESQNSNQKIQKFIQNYKNNIKIYCSEGDVVSQFNNIINFFGDSVTYLKGDNRIDYHLKDLDVISLIMSEISRHSTYGVDYNCFDEEGNIKETGKQITLNEIANGTIKSNEIDLLLKDAFSNNLKEIRDSIKNVELEENEYMKKYIVELYDSLIEYFEKNIGNYNYDSLIDTITPSITKIMHETVKKKVGWFAFISDSMNRRSNEKNINKYIKEYFLTNEGKESIEIIIMSIANERNEDIKNYLVSLGTNIYLKSDKTGINTFLYNVANFLTQKFEKIDKEIKKTPDQIQMFQGLIDRDKIIKAEKNNSNIFEENSIDSSRRL